MVSIWSLWLWVWGALISGVQGTAPSEIRFIFSLKIWLPPWEHFCETRREKKFYVILLREPPYLEKWYGFVCFCRIYCCQRFSAVLRYDNYRCGWYICRWRLRDCLWKVSCSCYVNRCVQCADVYLCQTCFNGPHHTQHCFQYKEVCYCITSDLTWSLWNHHKRLKARRLVCFVFLCFMCHSCITCIICTCCCQWHNMNNDEKCFFVRFPNMKFVGFSNQKRINWILKIVDNVLLLPWCFML